MERIWCGRENKSETTRRDTEQPKSSLPAFSEERPAQKIRWTLSRQKIKLKCQIRWCTLIDGKPPRDEIFSHSRAFCWLIFQFHLLLSCSSATSRFREETLDENLSRKAIVENWIFSFFHILQAKSLNVARVCFEWNASSAKNLQELQAKSFNWLWMKTLNTSSIFCRSDYKFGIICLTFAIAILRALIDNHSFCVRVEFEKIFDAIDWILFNDKFKCSMVIFKVIRNLRSLRDMGTSPSTRPLLSFIAACLSRTSPVVHSLPSSSLPPRAWTETKNCAKLIFLSSSSALAFTPCHDFDKRNIGSQLVSFSLFCFDEIRLGRFISQSFKLRLRPCCECN